MREQQPRDAEDAQARVGIGGPAGDAQQDQQQRHEECQGDHNAHKAQFLPHDREDEIGVLRGEEGEPFLTPKREPLPQQAP